MRNSLMVSWGGVLKGKPMLWNTINDLWDTMPNQGLWLSATGVVVVLFGVTAAYKFSKPKSHQTIKGQQDGWSPTGRIDFSDPQSIGNFILQAEDTRIVDSMGGVEHREIRWRKATLDEAKTVIVGYHAQRNLAMTANFIVSSSIRRKSDSDNEHPKAQLGKDEPDGKSQS
jgi:hypothetical protein